MLASYKLTKMKHILILVFTLRIWFILHTIYFIIVILFNSRAADSPFDFKVYQFLMMFL